MPPRKDVSTHEISSLTGLLDVIRRLDSGTRWIFRGMEDEQYLLVPKIGRTRHPTMRKQFSIQEERNLLWKFRDQVRPHVGLQISNDVEWMTLAQHHGLPTRMLDWTASPLVAAYFACKKIQEQVSWSIQSGGGIARHRRRIRGIVLAVSQPPKMAPQDRKDPFKLKSVKLIDPPHVSPRITRQMGLLTVHPSPAHPWEPAGLLRLVIPMQFKFSIMQELDSLGINAASLFPGIDATAEYLGWRFKWDKERSVRQTSKAR